MNELDKSCFIRFFFSHLFHILRRKTVSSLPYSFWHVLLLDLSRVLASRSVSVYENVRDWLIFIFISLVVCYLVYHIKRISLYHVFFSFGLNTYIVFLIPKLCVDLSAQE